jgi:flagellar hook-length control protein FliK
MRALPQIDIQPPSPQIQADAPARTSGRGEGGNFAETLQRSSVEKHASERPTPSPTDKPDKAEKSASSDNSTAKPAAQDGAPTKALKPATDSAANDDEVKPPSDDAFVDPALAALLVVPLVPASAAPQAATTPSELDPLAALAPLDDAAVAALTTASSSELNDVAQMPTTNVPNMAATTPTSTVADALVPTASAAPLANAALAAAPTSDAAPTADATLVASTAPALASTPPPAAAKTGESVQPLAAAVAAAGTELDQAAALPPVVAGNDAAKADLPPQAAPVVSAPAADAAAQVTTLPSAAAITTATPAAQPAGMHAVAAAIGEHDAKATATDAAVTAKTSNDLATPAAPQQPTTPVTPTRALSETVLAQNTLALQGNAMEKAVSHQVSKALVQNLPNGDRMMVLRLTPPELGTVKIEVIERQGVFSARMHAEDDGVRLALERFLPSMRQDLRASDAPIRELTLSDQTQFQRSFADGQQGQQQDANRSGNRRQREDAPRFSIDGVAREPVAVPRANPLGGRVGLSGVDAVA